MPFISVELGHATKEQKEKLISELTAKASEILGIDKQAFYMLVKENELDNWGVGGKTLSKIHSEKQK